MGELNRMQKMDSKNQTWQKLWTRRLALTFLIAATGVMLLGHDSTYASGPQDSEPAAASTDAQPGFWMQLLHTLVPFDSRGLMRLLGQKEFTILAFVALNLIVFVETGLLLGFFLPGDSLLVTAGVVCCASGWNLPLLLVTLCLSAIIGDSVGYSIGFKTGPKIFNREKSFFFKKDHLLAAQKFYEVHGGKTIILARFMPIIRTFAPVVAGVGKMDYRRFLFFNVFGGIGWVVSMVLIGYFLTDMFNPLVKTILAFFGACAERVEKFDVQDHIEKVIIIVVLLSVAPGGILWLKKKFGGKRPV